MSSFTPTDEQQKAVDIFGSGRPLVIQAGAGCGKSSTLALLGRSTNRRGQLIAFNKAIITDAAGKFSGNVTCSTAHSLAYRAVGKNFGHRLRSSQRMRSHDIARLMGIDPFVVETPFGRKPLAAGFLAGLANRAIERFCQTADAAPGREHVPYIDGIDLPTDDGRRTYTNNNQVARVVGDVLPAMWRDLSNPGGRLPYKHSHYLKTFQLSDPRIGADFILYDEAQDASDVMRAIVLAQEDAQLVFVGDSQQAIYCQPVGTLVEVPYVPGAARNGCVEPGCPRKRDHKGSGRCDLHERQVRATGQTSAIESPIFKVKTRWVPIETLAAGDPVVTHHNAHVFKRGRPVANVLRFRHTGPLIRVTTTSGLSSAYTPKHHCVVRVGAALRGRHVVYLMGRGDAYRIGRAPFFYESQGGLFGPGLRAGAERADALWILSVHDTVAEAALAEALAQHRFNIPGVRFEPTYAGDVLDVRMFWEKHGGNRVEAEGCLEHFGRLIDYPLWSGGRDRFVGVRRQFVTAAANLVDGMMVLPSGREKRDHKTPKDLWEPVVVTEEFYDGDVVSLEVADHHTYFADGILTHNSWNGAIDALESLPEWDRAFLSRSFRFGQPVADVANVVLGWLNAELRLTGSSDVASVVGPVADPDAILCRTNAKAVSTVLEHQQLGRRVHLVGGGREILEFAKAAHELMTGRKTYHPELACFDTWGEVADYVRTDSDGSELRMLVNLVNEYGVQVITAALDRMPSEASADVIVSTAHKGKGREWGSVRLASDLGMKPEEGLPGEEELRLLYVSVTRAQRELDVSAVGLLGGSEIQS